MSESEIEDYYKYLLSQSFTLLPFEIQRLCNPSNLATNFKHQSIDQLYSFIQSFNNHNYYQTFSRPQRFAYNESVFSSIVHQVHALVNKNYKWLPAVFHDIITDLAKRDTAPLTQLLASSNTLSFYEAQHLLYIAEDKNYV